MITCAVVCFLFYMWGITLEDDLVPLNLEIEVTCRRNNTARRRREKQEVQANQGNKGSSSSSFTVINPHSNFEERIMAEDCPQRVALEDYSSSSTPQYFTSIARPKVQAANITYLHSLIQLILGNLFHSLSNEDPYDHLATYIEIYNTMKIAGVPEDVIASTYFLFPWLVKQNDGFTHSRGITYRHGKRWWRSSWRSIFQSPRPLRGRWRSLHSTNSLMNHWVKLWTASMVYFGRLLPMGSVRRFSLIYSLMAYDPIPSSFLMHPRVEKLNWRPLMKLWSWLKI